MNRRQEREYLFNKTNGKCGYCGEPLEKGWHVDHVKPVVRHPFTKVMDYPERDCLENKIASCPSCNINKSSDSVDGFRRRIAMGVESMNKRMVQYKMAKKYGLVEETGIKVKFYFENLEE